MTAGEVATCLEAFVRERFHIPTDDACFARQCNLWEEGYVDSNGVVEVIVYIETTFDVVVPDEALFDPGFTSIDGLARIVCGLSPRRAVLATEGGTG